MKYSPNLFLELDNDYPNYNKQLFIGTSKLE